MKDALEALAEPKSIVAKLKAAGEFGCEVNRNIQLLDIPRDIEDVAKKIDAETDPEKKKSLEQRTMSS